MNNKAFGNVRLVVLGDVMLDRYWWGDVSRISPEAPVPIVRLSSTTYALGGAGNVAANIAGLGAKAVLLTVMGSDDNAELFAELTREHGVDDRQVVRRSSRHTTVKTRVIAHSQQMIRIDQETSEPIDEQTETSLLNALDLLADDCDGMVISDYGKGVITERLLTDALERCKKHDTPVFVDPKGKDYTKYAGSTVLTPNKREAADACGVEPNSPHLIEVARQQLLNRLGLEYLLITLGDEGMVLIGRQREPIFLPASSRNVYDVTGAGDCVIATLAVGVASGMNHFEAAKIANTAAGIVVERVGTSPIQPSDVSKLFAVDGS